MDDKLDPRTLRAKYPPNLNKKRVEEGEKKEKKEESKIIAQGKVIKQKKPFLKRFTEVFFGENTRDVCPYVIYEILLPSSKRMFSEGIKGGIDMLLFGEDRGYRPGDYRKPAGSYVSYDKYSERERDRDRYDGYSRSKGIYGVEDVILPTRRDAEEVREYLIEMIDKYDSVSIAAYYDIVGIHHTHTDRNYGWKNLRKSSINPVRGGGYVIEFPRPIYIND